MKTTASVTKGSHQDCSPCYLHFHIFFFYIYPTILLENKVVVITVFFSKLDQRPLVNYTYIMRLFSIFVIFVWNHFSPHAACSIHHVSLNLLSFNHYCFTQLCSNYVWTLKWVNLPCNWISLISVLNFPKQWVADCRCIFKILSNIKWSV